MSSHFDQRWCANFAHYCIELYLHLSRHNDCACGLVIEVNKANLQLIDARDNKH